MTVKGFTQLRISVAIPCLTMFYVLLLLGVLSQIGHTKDESNSFLVWARQYAQDVRHDPSWVCGLLPAPHASGLPWWVSPLQGNDWRKLQCYIHEAQAESLELRRATRSDVSQWPINMTLNQEGHGKKFSKDKSDAIIKKLSESFLSKAMKRPVIRDRNHRYSDGYFKIWDEQLWLTPILGRLSQVVPLCWEQHKPLHSSWSVTSILVGWIPLQWCQHTIILQAGDWFATDWFSRHTVRWAAPNGTQWLCGSNLWPWLPPGWIGRCTLGFPWMQGRWTKALHQPAHLSVSPHSRTRRAVQDRMGLSSHSAHSVGLRDVVWHTDSLTQYLDKVINHGAKESSLLDFEDQLMRKAALQNQMALDAVKAAEGGKCVVLKNECCVYMPNSKRVRPGPTTFTERLWFYLSEIAEWIWFLTISGIVFTLFVVGPLLSVYVWMVLSVLTHHVYWIPRHIPGDLMVHKSMGPNSFPSTSMLSRKKPD